MQGFDSPHLHQNKNPADKPKSLGMACLLDFLVCIFNCKKQKLAVKIGVLSINATRNATRIYRKKWL